MPTPLPMPTEKTPELKIIATGAYAGGTDNNEMTLPYFPETMTHSLGAKYSTGQIPGGGLIQHFVGSTAETLAFTVFLFHKKLFDQIAAKASPSNPTGLNPVPNQMQQLKGFLKPVANEMPGGSRFVVGRKKSSPPALRIIGLDDIIGLWYLTGVVFDIRNRNRKNEVIHARAKLSFVKFVESPI